MKNSQLRLKRIVSFCLIGMLFIAFSASAHADTGPKPSVKVTFTNLPESVCYGTLLAAAETYGPYRPATGPGWGDSKEARYRASEAFLDYAAHDAFFYWGNLYEIKDGYFYWGYYPPERFKILLFDTDSGAVYASGEAERYAFDSYYRATLCEDGTLRVEKESHLFKNLHNIAVRLLATVLVELLLALAFGYRTKRELLVILLANVVTQVLMNCFLAAADRCPDYITWMILFPLTELTIFVGEAITYAKCLSSHSKKRAVLYAIVANTASFFSNALISGILL